MGLSALPFNFAQRKGKFSISVDLIDAWPQVALAIMSEVIVTRAEMNFMDDAIHYEGLSMAFTPVELGSVVPIYRIQVDADAMDAGYKDVVKFHK